MKQFRIQSSTISNRILHKQQTTYNFFGIYYKSKMMPIQITGFLFPVQLTLHQHHLQVMRYLNDNGILQDKAVAAVPRISGTITYFIRVISTQG